MKTHQLTAYAYSSDSFFRFINNLACATEQNQREVLESIQVENVNLPLGGKKAIIRYALPRTQYTEKRDFFRNIESEYFVWPSERTRAIDASSELYCA